MSIHEYPDPPAGPAREAAAWAVLHPAEAALLTEVQADALRDLATAFTIVQAAITRRADVGTVDQLLVAMAPDDADRAEVTAALERIQQQHLLLQ